MYSLLRKNTFSVYDRILKYIMGSCCSYLCDCCGDKKNKEKKQLREKFPELSAPPDPTVLASTPSNLDTEEITDVHESNTDDVRCDKPIVESKGYRLLEEIGKGATSVVYRAVRISDSKIIACKVLAIKLLSNKTDKIRYGIKNELLIIQKTRHPHIVEVYDHFMIKRPLSQSVYIIMQFVENDLSRLMRKTDTRLEESMCQRMFAQMVSAVRYMHRKRIAHRDLKMANILLDSSHKVLMADFGMSTVAYRPSKGGLIQNYYVGGTPPYLAPEILKCRIEKSAYDPFKADIWALGVILHCMVNKAQPYNIDKDLTTQIVLTKLKEMKCKKIPLKTRHTPIQLSEHCIDLERKLLEFDPRKRMSSEQLAEHPWIRDQIKLINEEN